SKCSLSAAGVRLRRANCQTTDVPWASPSAASGVAASTSDPSRQNSRGFMSAAPGIRQGDLGPLYPQTPAVAMRRLAVPPFCLESAAANGSLTPLSPLDGFSRQERLP